MRKPIFVSAQEAVGMIQDYSTLCTIGMTLVSASETVLKAIEQKFLDTGTPRALHYSIPAASLTERTE